MKSFTNEEIPGKSLKKIVKNKEYNEMVKVNK